MMDNNNLPILQEAYIQDQIQAATLEIVADQLPYDPLYKNKANTYIMFEQGMSYSTDFVGAIKSILDPIIHAFNRIFSKEAPECQMPKKLMILYPVCHGANTMDASSIRGNHWTAAAIVLEDFNEEVYSQLVRDGECLKEKGVLQNNGHVSDAYVKEKEKDFDENFKRIEGTKDFLLKFSGLYQTAKVVYMDSSDFNAKKRAITGKEPLSETSQLGIKQFLGQVVPSEGVSFEFPNVTMQGVNQCGEWTVFNLVCYAVKEFIQKYKDGFDIRSKNNKNERIMICSNDVDIFLLQVSERIKKIETNHVVERDSIIDTINLLHKNPEKSPEEKISELLTNIADVLIKLEYQISSNLKSNLENLCIEIGVTPKELKDAYKTERMGPIIDKIYAHDARIDFKVDNFVNTDTDKSEESCTQDENLIDKEINKLISECITEVSGCKTGNEEVKKHLIEDLDNLMNNNLEINQKINKLWNILAVRYCEVRHKTGNFNGRLVSKIFEISKKLLPEGILFNKIFEKIYQKDYLKTGLQCISDVFSQKMPELKSISLGVINANRNSFFINNDNDNDNDNDNGNGNGNGISSKAN